MIHPSRGVALAVTATLLLGASGCAGSGADPVTAPTATEPPAGPATDAPPEDEPPEDEPPEDEPPEDGPAEDGPDPEPSTPRAPVQDGPLSGSWTEAFDVDLPRGRLATDCEGDALLICVLDDRGALLGDLALLEYAADPGLADDPATGLRTAAEGFVSSFQTDRAEGCQDFTFTPDEVSPASVGGATAVRTGFTLSDTEGRVVERVIVHLAYADGAQWTVQTDAYVLEGGCLPPSDVDPSFTPDVLTELEGTIDRLVAGTPLPPATGP